MVQLRHAKGLLLCKLQEVACVKCCRHRLVYLLKYSLVVEPKYIL
jgi:hypothetical protein